MQDKLSRRGSIDILFYFGLFLGKLNDRFIRAYFYAHAAVLTGVRIDDCMVVNDMDRVKLTGLFTFAAGNTAGSTLFTGLGAFVTVAAGYIDSALFRDQCDQLVWTDLGTGSTACAVHTVDPGDSVYNADRVKVAGVLTVAETDATVHAGPVTAVDRFVGFTGRHALVIQDLMCLFSEAAASDDRSLRFGRVNFESHDAAERSRAGRAAYGAGCQLRS